MNTQLFVVEPAAVRNGWYIMHYENDHLYFRKGDSLIVNESALEMAPEGIEIHWRGRILRCVRDLILEHCPARQLLNSPAQFLKFRYHYIPLKYWTQSEESNQRPIMANTNKENTMLTPMSFDEESKPLTAGTYSARIVGAENRTGKTSGNPYINWQLELFGSPDVNGKRVYYMTMTTGQMVSKLAEFHKAATGEEIDRKATQYDPEMLVGKEVNATLVMGSYQGKERPEIKSIARLN